MKPLFLRGYASWFVKRLFIAVVYFIAAKFSFMLRFEHTNASPVITGIALAAVLLLSHRIWPSIAIGAFFANFLQLSALGFSVPISIVGSFSTAIGNTLEVLVGAFLIRHFIADRNPFNRSMDILTFVIFGAFIGTTISATIGVSTLSIISGSWSNYGLMWLTWWLGDAAGVLLVTPAIIIGSKRIKLEWQPVRITETVLLLAFLFILGRIIFLDNHITEYHIKYLEYLLIPLIIWAAFRFGQFGSAIMNVLLSGIAIFGTVRGSGPFASLSLNESLLLVVGFISTISVTSMLLSSTIAEGRKAEEKMREASLYTRSLIEVSLDPLVTISLEGKITDVNIATEHATGVSRQQLIGSDFTDYFTEPKKAREGYKQVFEKGFVKDYPLAIMHVSGSITEVLYNATVYKDATGNVAGVFATARDVTEHNRMEMEKARMALMLDIAPNSITVSKLDGHLLYANQRTLEMHGYSRDEFMALKLHQLYAPASATLIAPKMQELLDNGEATFQLEHLRKDGTLLPLEVYAIITTWGNIKSVLSIATDITDRKLTEEKIEASLKEKEILLSEIYHRVKNNMQIIISLLGLQSRHVKEEKYREMFKESQNRILSMSLVHEKLYQSKDLTQIDFNEYVRDLIKGLFRSYGANKGNIVLKIDVKTILLGIDHAIPCGLIINELVTNSLKYAFPDRREGEIKVVLHPTEENMIELAVGDNGIGIPEDMDFKQTKTLGLHLVTMLAENQLHGDITLNRSKGTEFIIKFKKVK
jgi:PAS domain S-box-containing protein